jgi:hypothetical protein
MASGHPTPRELADFALYGTASTDLSVQTFVHPERNNPE